MLIKFIFSEPVIKKSSVVAFTGAGHSLGSPTDAAAAVDHHKQEECNDYLMQSCPSQMMEVDSTQDSAIMTLAAHNAVVFDESSAAGEAATPRLMEDDDFFEVTAEDVRRLHRDQMHQLQELSETPLLTKEMRAADEQARLLACLRNFPVTILRIQFPGGLAVQARFRPTDTVQDVAVFVGALLRDEALMFDLLNLFPREPLSRLQTLHAAGLVPRARVLFSPHEGSQVTEHASLLKPSVLTQLASRRHAQEALVHARNNSTACRSGLLSSSSSARQTHRPSANSTSAGGDVGPPKKPKWFKLAKTPSNKFSLPPIDHDIRSTAQPRLLSDAPSFKSRDSLRGLASAPSPPGTTKKRR
ncbi:UBX domain [Trinorchestia longiramus]|nr:UBX domain [Trinorchestia longiramus]